MPFTVAAVPTGMKRGVCTAPWGVCQCPQRARVRGHRAVMVKAKAWDTILAGGSDPTRQLPRRGGGVAGWGWSRLPLCHVTLSSLLAPGSGRSLDLLFRLAPLAPNPSTV
jgi:hypothetical protein